MPLPITLAHELVYLMDKNRLKPEFNYIKSDMKSQVTINYTDSNNLRIDTFLVSIQHTDKCNQKDIEKFVSPLMDQVAKNHN